jgi:hypothetical protein
MKVPVIDPTDVSEQLEEVTGDPEIEHVGLVGIVPVSLAVTPTVAPTGAAAGVKVTGKKVATLRVADAESPVLPVTVIV